MNKYTHEGKAIPLQAWTGPEGYRRLGIPDFMTVGIWRWKGCQPYAPAAFTVQEIFLLLISFRGSVDPRTTVQPMSRAIKFPKTSSGIEPATCRLEAQCLNQLRTGTLQTNKPDELHNTKKNPVSLQTKNKTVFYLFTYLFYAKTLSYLWLRNAIFKRPLHKIRKTNMYWAGGVSIRPQVSHPKILGGMALNPQLRA